MMGRKENERMRKRDNGRRVNERMRDEKEGGVRLAILQFTG